MAKTLLNLDNQAQGLVFAFGASTGSASKLTLNVGASAVTTNVLDVKGSSVVAGNVHIATAPSANEHAANKLYVDGKASAAEGAANTYTDGKVSALVGDNVTIERVGNAFNVKSAGISATQIASNAITTVKISDGNVTTSKIANDAVDFTKLQNINQNIIVGRATAGSGDAESLSAAQVRTILNVADGANNYVHPNHSGDVTSVADGATTIVANAVTSTKIADNAVIASKIATDAVTNTKIQNNAVDANKLASDAVTTAKILNANVTLAKIDTAAYATSNTVSTLVQRNASGNFSANEITASKVTGLSAPSAASDATNKSYVDNLVSGLDIKASVKAATTANITLSGTQSVDGVALIAGDRVLVKNQTTASQNGIYVVAAGAWTRATDADENYEVTAGMFFFVEQGSQFADTGWVLSTDGVITVGTTALTFTQFSSAGIVDAGTGLQKVGNTISVQSGGITSAMIADGTIVDADVSGSANINGSKLLANSVTATQIAPTTITNAEISATAAIAPSKIATDASNRFVTDAEKGIWNAKEGAITAGTTAQYWRGDKTWQTLNTTAVAEGTNLYFTDARVRAVALTGLAITNSAIVAADSVLVGLGKAQGQINAINASVAAVKKNQKVPFTLAGAVATISGTKPEAATLMVYVNGLLQSEDAADDYTYNAGTGAVTFTFTPEAGDKIIIYGSI